MILLPNGCSCSNISVHPRNWKTKKASLKIKWYIFYRFYDPMFKDDPKYKGNKLVVLKGIDKYTDLEQRQQVVQAMLDNELELLTKFAYNPITGEKTIPQEVEYIIDPCTPFLPALRKATENLSVADSTMIELDMVIRCIEGPAKQIRIDTLAIKDITRKHIRRLLDQCKRVHDHWSAHKFNRYRSCLMILFSELQELEATEIDPVTKVKKQKTTKRLREVLTDEQRVKINAYLKPRFYTFWRLIQIFFHSGGREAEMLQLKVKDVNLKNQTYKLLIKKGKQQEKLKTIKDSVLPLWTELIEKADPEYYVFSEGLVPGPKTIRREQITRRWKQHVKDKLGVTADFYALKHLNTTAVVKVMSKREKALQIAASLNSHESTAMVKNIYDVEAEQSEHEILKSVNNEF